VDALKRCILATSANWDMHKEYATLPLDLLLCRI
jgi:hypothetical protein